MDIQELLKTIDVVDFFNQYTELEQKGREWWGLTPFKEERTPSFSVDPDNRVFYCFSTGIGGTVIDFLKAYYKCSSREAIEKLKEYCGKEGITLDFKERLAATGICKKFRRKVKNTKPSTAKVLPESCMDKYMEDKNLDVWVNEGISREILKEYQVKYDPFGNRLVYPIRNLNGEIVNIGGRTLDPEWKEKNIRKYTYYHTWGTIDIIFGLYESLKNKTGILSTKNLTIFEGAKSVMLANTYGIRDCGAILTSHLNHNQTVILLHLCSRQNIAVTFALDKEVDIHADKNIMMLKKYLNVYYIEDRNNLLPDPKMAPIDMGEDIFRKLFDERRKL